MDSLIKIKNLMLINKWYKLTKSLNNYVKFNHSTFGWVVRTLPSQVAGLISFLNYGI